MDADGLENHPLVTMLVGMVMRLSAALLSSHRVGEEKVKVGTDPGLKTGKAERVGDKKEENRLTINILKE